MLLQIHQLVEAGDVVKPDWNGYNVLHDAASRVAALDIGFLPSASAQEVRPLSWVLILHVAHLSLSDGASSLRYQQCNQS